MSSYGTRVSKVAEAVAQNQIKAGASKWCISRFRTIWCRPEAVALSSRSSPNGYCAAGTGNDSSGFRRLGFEKLRYILDHHIGEIVRITAVSGAARGIRPVGEILLRSQRLVDVHSSLDSHITSEKRGGKALLTESFPLGE